MQSKFLISAVLLAGSVFGVINPTYQGLPDLKKTEEVQNSLKEVRTSQLYSMGTSMKVLDVDFLKTSQTFGLGIGQRSVINRNCSSDLSLVIPVFVNGIPENLGNYIKERTDFSHDAYATMMNIEFRALALFYPFESGLYAGLGVAGSPIKINYAYDALDGNRSNYPYLKDRFFKDAEFIATVFGRAAVGYEWSLRNNRAMFVQVSGFYPITASVGVGF